MLDFRSYSRNFETIYKHILSELINTYLYATYSAITYLTAASVADAINLILFNTSIII
jgi:hypothetical protein